ncbi:MAG: DNA-3-methyladenine glycosylase [Lachnospiraceae bacterium]|nr:DNA-3-methyladenine glycosylase [Lachnospiraceae bacterium]
MAERLGRDYFCRPADVLAGDLIGKLLCRKTADGILRCRIMETECYYGEEDTACHASKGRTERTKILYEKGGTAYVYLCYGMHFLFNIVTGSEGHPEAALIRGITGYNGPGKLTRAMQIDKRLNGEDMAVSDELWVEDDGCRIPVRTDKRVGIDYATPEYRDILWRYIADDGTYHPAK